MKKCSNCKKIKPLNEFYSNKARSTKTYSRCILCEKEYIKVFRSTKINYSENELFNEFWESIIINNVKLPYMISSIGRVLIMNSNKIAKPSFDQRGYLQIVLSYKSIRISRRIHRLVAETFIVNDLNKREVNHIDGNKLNNSIDNLEWVTSKENTAHAIKNNLR